MNIFLDKKYSLISKLTALTTVLLILLCSCNANVDNRYEAQFFEYFDTLSTIVAYCKSDAEFETLSNNVEEELKIYHELYDIYNDYPNINNIKTINDNAGIKPIVVDEKIIDLLLFSREQYNSTSHYVNPAMGSVTSIWNEYRNNALIDPKNAKLPSQIELDVASEHMDFSEIEINTEDKTVYLPDSNMSLDVGAIAKGYVIEDISKNYANNGFINIGGNVKVLGFKPDNTAWNVGIQNYDKNSEEELLFLLEISDFSLATSGNYERFYEIDAKNYHHIINPDTMYPSDYYHSVSVICENPAIADALSTALFNMPLDVGSEYVDTLENTYVIWINSDETVHMSDGVESFIVNEY